MPKYGQPWTQKQRDRIAASGAIDRVIKFTRNEEDMSALQLKANLALIDKVLPTMKATEHSGEVQGGVVKVIIGS